MKENLLLSYKTWAFLIISLSIWCTHIPSACAAFSWYKQVHEYIYLHSLFRNLFSIFKRVPACILSLYWNTKYKLRSTASDHLCLCLVEEHGCQWCIGRRQLLSEAMLHSQIQSPQVTSNRCWSVLKVLIHNAQSQISLQLPWQITAITKKKVCCTLVDN